MPTPTDLVTDLPADFEVFGQAVDTSMADLKGGTSGQILAKNSNTDMDFVWITNDQGDITGITASSPLTGGGTSGAVTIGILNGTTSNLGAVQLSDSTSSTSTTLAATANAVKQAYDPAFTNNFYAGKNHIINGDMGIWQRGTSFASAANGSYSADRFKYAFDGSGTATISQQAFTAGAAPVAGYESQYFLRHLVTSAGSTTFTQIFQPIEDVRTFAGQTVTFSFWAKADSARSSFIYAEQNFGSGGSATVQYLSMGSASLTTSWQRFSFTVALSSISGKTIGTGSQLNFYIRGGTALNASTDIWGVQVESGSTATPFQTATGTIQGELAACQRYYWRNTSVGNASNYYCYALGTAYSSTRAAVFFQHPVTMRTAPSFAYSGSIQIVQGSTGNAISAISIDSNSSTQTLLNVTTSSLTTGYGNHMGSTNNTTSFIELSAEL